MVGLDFQPVSNDLPVAIHRVWPIVSDLDSLIHLEALPKMIDYRLQDPFQFREVMQPSKHFSETARHNQWFGVRVMERIQAFPPWSRVAPLQLKGRDEPSKPRIGGPGFIAKFG
jgi:hypothetical protein